MSKNLATIYDNIITPQLVEKVASFEGFRSSPYLCPGGIWTIGYGHSLGKSLDKDYQNASITSEEALCLLRSDLRQNLVVLYDLIAGLQIHQYQCLLDFVFNCGLGTLKRSSFYRYLINYANKDQSTRKAYDKAITNTLLKYCYAGGKKLSGLYKRRSWEVDLWKNGNIYS